MDSQPEDKWFCVACQEKSLYQVEAIVDKQDKMKRLCNGRRTGKARVRLYTTRSSGRVPSGRGKTRGSRSRTCKLRA